MDSLIDFELYIDLLERKGVKRLLELERNTLTRFWFGLQQMLVIWIIWLNIWSRAWKFVAMRMGLRVFKGCRSGCICLLGRWEEAANDLHVASKLDLDDAEEGDEIKDLFKMRKKRKGYG
ncbi:hypothetical protein L6452_12477 [Arctium lappa]|uniref:Uncharacterized protein n=1 Tax=Arctium lappa TaxID=4217 RepID=A0ACB9DRF1_ARCLA|nr:hypothetical protein L6452_12477 [Arctium lappa]